MDWTHLLYTVGGSLLAWFANRYLGERKWGQIRDAASQILKDPAKTSDPREAITQAMVDSQFSRLQVEAKKVQDAFVLNGSNPIPKLDIDIEEVSELPKKDDSK